MFRLTTALLLASVSALASSADAQDARWLLLPAGDTGEPPRGIEPHFETIAEELRERGVYVLAYDEARALFEARASADATAASESDLDIVAREANAALVHVATGRNEQARRSVSRVLERAERALESLNRETDSARYVLNACLYLVRAMLDSGNRDAALTRVLECRRLVPDIAPDPHDHPPAVLSLLREAETQLATEPTGTLRVTSRPSGCAVFVNGRRLGETPYTISDLPPGEYRVQAECGGDRRGRVHRIVLAAEATTVHVDSRLDGVLRSRPELALAYGAPDSAEQHRFYDAIAVGRPLDAAAVLLITKPGSDVLRLDAIDVQARRVLASVRVSTRGSRRDVARRLAEAVQALTSSRSVDLTGDEPAPLEPWAPPPPPAAPADASPREVASTGAPASGGTLASDRVMMPSTAGGSAAIDDEGASDAGAGGPPTLAGFVVGGAGVVALGVTWGLWAHLGSQADHFGAAFPEDPDYLARQRRFDDAQIPVLITGGIGGVALTTAMPMLLPRADGAPWWAWALGGAGAIVAGAGIVVLAGEGECVDMGCTRRDPNGVLGATLLFHAAPLLSVPIVYLVRGDGGGEAPVANVRLAPGAGELVVGGRF